MTFFPPQLIQDFTVRSHLPRPAQIPCLSLCLQQVTRTLLNPTLKSPGRRSLTASPHRTLAFFRSALFHPALMLTNDSSGSSLPLRLCFCHVLIPICVCETNAMHWFDWEVPADIRQQLRRACRHADPQESDLRSALPYELRRNAFPRSNTKAAD